MRQGQYLSLSIGCRSNVQELREGIDRWIRFYNFERPIKALMGLSLPPSTKALHSTYPFPKQSTKCLTCQKMGTRIVQNTNNLHFLAEILVYFKYFW